MFWQTSLAWRLTACVTIRCRSPRSGTTRPQPPTARRPPGHTARRQRPTWEVKPGHDPDIILPALKGRAGLELGIDLTIGQRYAAGGQDHFQTSRHSHTGAARATEDVFSLPRSSTPTPADSRGPVPATVKLALSVTSNASPQAPGGAGLHGDGLVGRVVHLGVQLARALAAASHDGGTSCCLGPGLPSL